MKGQRGQAFILVLIFLAVGALLIVPVLNYAFTGLRSQRISEDVMANQYAADSALEDALWQMLNDILVGQDPTDNYTFVFGLERFKVNIKIPEVPESEWTKDKEIYVKVEVQPKWVEAGAGETPFTYIIRINSPQWDLTYFGFTLPPGLTYTDNSTWYTPPEHSYEPEPWGTPEPDSLDPDIPIGDRSLVWTQGDEPETSPEPEGKQRLEWMPMTNFIDPKTGKLITGRRLFIQTFQATGNPGWGIHYVEPLFAFTEFTLETGPTGAFGVAIYNIIIDVEGVTYQVVVAYDSTTDEMKIVSYQIVE